MTIREIIQLPDDELYELSLQKDENGRYTGAANAAYDERRRRSGVVRFEGVAKKCGKYQADIDYYGNSEWGE